MYQMHPKNQLSLSCWWDYEWFLFSYFCFSKSSRFLTLNLYILMGGGVDIFKSTLETAAPLTSLIPMLMSCSPILPQPHLEENLSH